MGRGRGMPSSNGRVDISKEEGRNSSGLPPWAATRRDMDQKTCHGGSYAGCTEAWRHANGRGGTRPPPPQIEPTHPVLGTPGVFTCGWAQVVLTLVGNGLETCFNVSHREGEFVVKCHETCSRVQRKQCIYKNSTLTFSNSAGLLLL